MLFEENLILALEEILPDVVFVLAYRDHTEPIDPYCLVQQVSIYPTAQAEINTSHKKGSPAVEIVTTPTNCVFNLSFYCQSNSVLQEVARRFQMGLQSNKFAFALNKNGLSISGLTKIMYTHESINTTTSIKRATLQLTTSGIVTETWEIGDIDVVEHFGEEKSGFTLIDDKYDTQELKWQLSKR